MMFISSQSKDTLPSLGLLHLVTQTATRVKGEGRGEGIAVVLATGNSPGANARCVPPAGRCACL